MAQFEKLTAPSQGTPIRFENGQPVVADNPIIPFIRGDGTGVDIWPAPQKVLDAAVAKAYGGAKTIKWFLPGLGFSMVNIEEASKAAKDRAIHLNKLKEKKNC